MALVRCTQRLNYIFLPMFSNPVLYHHSMKPIDSSSTMPVIKQETIQKIEQLSLLNVDDDYGFSVLKAAIIFTENLRNTKINKEIEPMYSPFETESMLMRNDNVEHNISRKEILMNAAITEEEYFVAPLQTIVQAS
ncbi:glutamyl-tRNA(Gln) amidotransferase subunit C, mitochondrial [Bombus impatiens]|uniref:Glutamyl-tRNA(Gln) amidotransferase subunit C, mitochondrial n=1 Tax=Bombus impatiens TaxID=132113 RepID=A0A6P3UNK4_BOMIM|nr:glutamyl-tRNA(Gln) amidotransferase subunit C, mitochondrial [Bombus impatiens]